MKHASKLSFAVMALVGLSLTGCQIVASPLAGGIYNETKYGFNATDEAVASKEGKACATSILGWVATGDASIQAAKTSGGISKVASVDHSAKNILGIYGEWCTIVRGN
jgi:hypothetical protein